MVVGLTSSDRCLVIIAVFLVGKRKFPMFCWACTLDAALIIKRPEFWRTNDSRLLASCSSTFEATSIDASGIGDPYGEVGRESADFRAVDPSKDVSKVGTVPSGVVAKDPFLLHPGDKWTLSVLDICPPVGCIRWSRDFCFTIPAALLLL